MTTSKSAEVKRRKGGAPEVPDAFAARMLYELRLSRTTASELRWPDPRWWEDPVSFFRLILGVEPWHKQIEVIEAVRDNARTSVASGHKVSKSHTAAGIALCFYASHQDARVVMSSTTARQVDQILWRELRMMRSRAGRCTACKAADPDQRTIPAPCPHSATIDGDIGDLARTGLKSGFREIVGFTAKEAEAVAGISGANLLYILDEASGIPEVIFEAIEGNRAGGARLVMFSNPTRTSGTFYDSFHSKKRFYKAIQISSEETPNVTEGRIVIPGLATREWVNEKREEWGEDSPLYKVRVRGEFVTSEDGKIFSIDLISQAEQRWHEQIDAWDGLRGLARQEAEWDLGRLWLGIDPAGASGTGDESAFAARRGPRQLAQKQMRGLSAEGHLVQALSILKRLRAEPRREVPVVVLDGEGNVGAEVTGLFRAHSTANPRDFQLVVVRSSDGATESRIYDRRRDELTGNLEKWVRSGGQLLEDSKLEQEMHEMEWIHLERSGRLKVTPKRELKKKLGRSPDRYDALANACWEPPITDEDDPPGTAPARAEDDDDRPDPYGGRWWEGRR